MIREEELAEVFPFWEKLKKQQRDSLRKETKHLLLSKGDRLSCADSPYGCFFIRKGGFSALILGESDTETELFRVKRDSFCILDHSLVCGQEIIGMAYHALTNADIYLIGKDIFTNLVKTNPSFTEVVVSGLLYLIPGLVSAIEQRDYFNLEKRIVQLLLSESQRQRSNTVLITHNQIASKIGSAREAVTRKLAEFTEEELITHARGRITILNKEKMKKRHNLQ